MNIYIEEKLAQQRRSEWLRAAERNRQARTARPEVDLVAVEAAEPWRGLCRARAAAARGRAPAGRIAMNAQPIFHPTALAIKTRDGSTYTLRRATPQDAGLLVELLGRLSSHTLWLRYMAGL